MSDEYLIVAGNLSDGFRFHGPFASFDDADEASREFTEITWIAPLNRHSKSLDPRDDTEVQRLHERIKELIGERDRAWDTIEKREELIERMRLDHLKGIGYGGRR